MVRNKVNEEGVQVLEKVYSWKDPNNINTQQHATNTVGGATTTPTATTNQNVKFQRNLSFDDHPKSPNLAWNRKSFDAKRKPLVHSKSFGD